MASAPRTRKKGLRLSRAVVLVGKEGRRDVSMPVRGSYLAFFFGITNGIEAVCPPPLSAKLSVCLTLLVSVVLVSVFGSAARLADQPGMMLGRLGQ